jgi:hypothetical protein
MSDVVWAKPEMDRFENDLFRPRNLLRSCLGSANQVKSGSLSLRRRAVPVALTISDHFHGDFSRDHGVDSMILHSPVMLDLAGRFRMNS